MSTWSDDVSVVDSAVRWALLDTATPPFSAHMVRVDASALGQAQGQPSQPPLAVRPICLPQQQGSAPLHFLSSSPPSSSASPSAGGTTAHVHQPGRTLGHGAFVVAGDATPAATNSTPSDEGTAGASAGGSGNLSNTPWRPPGLAVGTTVAQSGIQLLGYLPDGRPVFAPAAKPQQPPSAGGLHQQQQPTPSALSLATPIAVTAVGAGVGTPSPVATTAPTIRIGPAPVPTVTVGARPAPTAALRPAATAPVAPPISVKVGALPTPTVKVGVAATPSATASPTEGVSRPSPSIRVGSAASASSSSPVAGGTAAAAVAAMPLSRRPDNHGAAVASPPANDAASVSSASSSTVAAATSASGASVRPPVLTVAQSPTASLVARAVADGMSPGGAARHAAAGGPPSPSTRGRTTTPSHSVGAPLLTPTTSVRIGGSPALTPSNVSVKVGVASAAAHSPSGVVQVGESRVVYFGGRPSLCPAPLSNGSTASSPQNGNGKPVVDVNGALNEVNAWQRFAMAQEAGDGRGTATTVGDGEARVVVPLSRRPPQLLDMASGAGQASPATVATAVDGAQMPAGGPRLSKAAGDGGVARSPSLSQSRRGVSNSSRVSAGSASTSQSSTALPWRPVLKTKLCKAWCSAPGSCKYGAKCMFAHGEDDLVVVQPADAVAGGPTVGGRSASRGSSSGSPAYVGVLKSQLAAAAVTDAP